MNRPTGESRDEDGGQNVRAVRQGAWQARIAYITSLSHILIRPWIAVPQANARDSSVPVDVIARNRH